jgi:hypothetical protein
MMIFCELDTFDCVNTAEDGVLGVMLEKNMLPVY